MKMKLGLYFGFFVLFTFVFSQIAFPLSARVTGIHVRNAGSAGSVPVFDAIRSNAGNSQSMSYEYLVKDAVFEEAANHHFIEYEINVESTGLIPIDILNSKITVKDKYKDRVLVRAIEPYEKQVSAIKPSNKRFMVLIDADGMTPVELREMIRSIDVHITWKPAVGRERVNKVYLPEEAFAF